MIVVIISSRLRLTWAPLGETGDDDLGFSCFRALSTSTDNGSYLQLIVRKMVSNDWIT